MHRIEVEKFESIIRESKKKAYRQCFGTIFFVLIVCSAITALAYPHQESVISSIIGVLLPMAIVISLRIAAYRSDIERIDTIANRVRERGYV